MEEEQAKRDAEAAARAPPKPQEEVTITKKIIRKDERKLERGISLVGQPLDYSPPSPMSMINKAGSAPLLSAEKKEKKAKPLDPFVKRAAESSSTMWRRLYQLGDKAELFVVVRVPTDGTEFSPTDEEDNTGGHAVSGPTPLEVVLTTDSPNDLVLHWGTLTHDKKRGWNRPPATCQPPGTVKMEHGPSVETAFEGFKASSSFAPDELREALVPLQRITIPVGLDVAVRGGVAGLTFVLRSEDGSRWYKEGNSDFYVPLPRHGVEEEGEEQIEDEIVQHIVSKEQSSAWTLMHRYNECSYLLNEITSGNIG